MARIRKGEKREMPALNTSSLPDIIFMLLFFFMTVTSMKEVTYKVTIQNPSATELTKLEKKSLVRYVYVGSPTMEFRKQFGAETRIQLDDAFADKSEIGEYIVTARRNGKDWYIGGMTDWTQRNNMTIDLSFLPAGTYEADLFCDGKNAAHNAEDWQRKQFTVQGGNDSPAITLAPGGGFAMKLIAR